MLGLSDTEWILVVLALIYSIESCAWLRKGNVVFSTFLGRFTGPRFTSPIANERGSLVFCSPLPFEQTLFGEPWPVAISPEGVLSYTATNLSDQALAEASPRFFRFDDIHSIQARGAALVINGVDFGTCRSASSAHWLSDFLKHVSKLSHAERAPAIHSALQESVEVSRIRAELARLGRETFSLRVAATLLFVQIFAIGPAFYYTYHAAEERYAVLGKYLALTFVCWLATIVLYFLSHRRLFPQRRGERRKQALTYLVSPASAMRSADTLGRDLLTLTHPLAVAIAVNRPKTVHRFARQVWIDFLNPIPPAEPLSTNGQAVFDWYRTELEGTLRDLLAAGQIDVDALVTPPATIDEGAKSYCPRCERQFVHETGSCSECGGLPLQLLREAH